MTRSRLQLETTPSEYIEAQEIRRQKTLRELFAILRQGREHNAPWYLWIVWRREGRHMHDLRNEKGERVACPVPGCDAVRELMSGRIVDGDGVCEPVVRVDAVDQPVAPVPGALQELAGLEADGPVDLGVPVSAGAVVELDVPVPGLDHDPEPTP